MRKTGLCLAAIGVLFWPGIAPQGQAQSPAQVPADAQHYDGKWQTTVTCEALRGALGFSYRFESLVKDGHLRGLRGTEGQPSYLLVEGDIAADGSARLYAKGMTGSKEYVPGRDTQPGTDFGYHVKAQFEEKKGTGTREEGRACSYEFERK
jgi:hypothetical protein